MMPPTGLFRSSEPGADNPFADSSSLISSPDIDRYDYRCGGLLAFRTLAAQQQSPPERQVSATGPAAGQSSDRSHRPV